MSKNESPESRARTKARMQPLIAPLVTAPLEKRSSPISWPDPPGNIADDVMERVWQEEREGR